MLKLDKDHARKSGNIIRKLTTTRKTNKYNNKVLSHENKKRPPVQ